MSAAENLESLKQRLTQLGLYGLLAHWEGAWMAHGAAARGVGRCAPMNS